MRSEIISLLNNMLPSVTPYIVLTNKRTVGSLFKYKDTLPLMSRSHVIYKYACPPCGAVYVGSTARTLHTRVSEHLGVSPRTNLPVSTPSHSAIRDHSENTCQCAPTRSSFSIIDSDSNNLSLRIKESIHILTVKPSLNETVTSFPIYILQ